MNKTAILFKCYYDNKDALREFKRIIDACDKNIFDVFFSYDNTRNDLRAPSEAACHVFNERSICAMYPELYKINQKVSLWKNPEHSTIHFFLQHPGYSFYWIVDHDVRFTGDWNSFFSTYLGNDADLVATYISKYGQRNWHVDVEEKWPFWRDGNLKFEDWQKTRAFFAIYRFSNRALSFLNTRYGAGDRGFCEMIIPTLLDISGFKIDDIGYRYYNKDTFNYFGRRTRAGDKNEFLYHPVLPLKNVMKRRIHSLRKEASFRLSTSRSYVLLSYYLKRLSARLFARR